MMQDSKPYTDCGCHAFYLRPSCPNLDLKSHAPVWQRLGPSHFKLPQDVALHASAADGAQRLAPPQQQLCARRAPAHQFVRSPLRSPIPLSTLHTPWLILLASGQWSGGRSEGHRSSYMLHISAAQSDLIDQILMRKLCSSRRDAARQQRRCTQADPCISAPGKSLGRGAAHSAR